MLSTDILLGGLRLDVDGTFFIQLALLTALFFILNALVFQPFLQSLEIRDEKTSKTRERAQQLEERAAELTSRLEESMSSAREAAQAARRSLRVEGLQERDTEVGAARAAQDDQLQSARKELESQLKNARGEAQAQVETLARSLASKALGRSV